VFEAVGADVRDRAFVDLGAGIDGNTSGRDTRNSCRG
jgi:hypothetical protein